MTNTPRHSHVFKTGSASTILETQSHDSPPLGPLGAKLSNSLDAIATLREIRHSEVQNQLYANHCLCNGVDLESSLLQGISLRKRYIENEMSGFNLQTTLLPESITSIRNLITPYLPLWLNFLQ